jgi:hypothetical protein
MTLRPRLHRILERFGRLCFARELSDLDALDAYIDHMAGIDP